MTHIVAVGSIFIIVALVPALTWRRYRRSPRTIRDRRQFIGRLSFCGLMGAFLAATHFIHGDELPGWVSYLGDLASGPIERNASNSRRPNHRLHQTDRP